MNAKERREFVRSHRIGVFGYSRRDHGPAMSVVYYVMAGDDILISTMAERSKPKLWRAIPGYTCVVWWSKPTPVSFN
jgi:nitroimidazol reductase NimA-like FMN-containing flavoprotein (pyridoxamine 5'-phosphate oxidase superfamily)